MLPAVFRRGRLWRAAWAALVLIGVATPLLLRVAWEGRAELAAADVAAAEGRIDLEIVHLGRAARWRAPLVGHDDEALARLMRVGADAEAEEGGTQTALSAYREARGALLATRAWGLADPALYEQANARIAALMAAQEQVFGTDLSRTGASEAYHRELLAQAPTGDPAWPSLLWLALLAGLAALLSWGGRTPAPSSR
jgi:hypothetical protein